MKRSRHESMAYAMRRLSLAIDRGIMALDDKDREQANRWACAWHACAYARLDILARLNSSSGGDRQQ